MRIAVTLVVGLAACAASASAQSLADAARHAAEQQREHAVPSQSFTDQDLLPDAGDGASEAMSLQLTMPLLQRYAAARTAMLRQVVAAPDSFAPVRAAIGVGRSVHDLEQAYQSSAPVADAIRGSSMTVHEYVVTEVAFMAAVGVLAGKLPQTGVGTLPANVAFLSQHQHEVEVLWRDATRLQAQLAQSAAQSTAAPPR